MFCCAYFEKTTRFAEIFLLWQLLAMILNDFFEFTDAISCNLLLCFTRALSFWTFAMCRGCPVCFLIVDRPTLPIYIGISKTKTKDIARQFAKIHQWKQTGLPQHLKLWALLFSGWHISFSVMQKAASMAGVLELIFSPAVLVTFQGLIGNFAVFCHKFEHCWLYALCVLIHWAKKCACTNVSAFCISALLSIDLCCNVTFPKILFHISFLTKYIY